MKLLVDGGIAPAWPGATVAIIAGGASLTAAQVRLVARAKLDGRCRAIAVNDAVYLAWWADWLHACDRRWWKHHGDRLAGFGGARTSLEAVVDGVLTLRDTGLEGFDPDPRCLRNGGNGAYQALHGAVHAGARRVLLLGVDLKDERWFGAHPWATRAMPPDWFVIARTFLSIVPALHEKGVEVINCSEESALGAFPKAALTEDLLSCGGG